MSKFTINDYYNSKYLDMSKEDRFRDRIMLFGRTHRPTSHEEILKNMKEFFKEDISYRHGHYFVKTRQSDQNFLFAEIDEIYWTNFSHMLQDTTHYGIVLSAWPHLLPQHHTDFLNNIQSSYKIVAFEFMPREDLKARIFLESGLTAVQLDVIKIVHPSKCFEYAVEKYDANQERYQAINRCFSGFLEHFRKVNECFKANAMGSLLRSYDYKLASIPRVHEIFNKMRISENLFKKRFKRIPSHERFFAEAYKILSILKIEPGFYSGGEMAAFFNLDNEIPYIAIKVTSGPKWVTFHYAGGLTHKPEQKEVDLTEFSALLE